LGEICSFIKILRDSADLPDFLLNLQEINLIQQISFSDETMKQA